MLGVIWSYGPVSLPYYRRDVELDQALDREHAIELLHSCWLKLLEVNKIRSVRTLKLPQAARCIKTSPLAVRISHQRSASGRSESACLTPFWSPADVCVLPSPTSVLVRYHAGMSNDFGAVGSSTLRLWDAGV